MKDLGYSLAEIWQKPWIVFCPDTRMHCCYSLVWKAFLLYTYIDPIDIRDYLVPQPAGVFETLNMTNCTATAYAQTAAPTK